ncbi:MAG: NAD(P)/FAD-dependent oxidoreductase [Deltaproteobacteria bacterium]|nr:NAD(P)/FAD-dependent oxidoreductase [Deltaproteobacteria bacterium]
MPCARSRYDAVIVGSGPNGLAAAIELARTGLSTLVVEARDTAGGGTRTRELTLPGFLHDVCSTVHPLGFASPFFQELRLERFGLAWVHPPAPLVHVMDDGTGVALERSVEATAANLGEDGPAYRRLIEPLAGRFTELLPMVLAGMRLPHKPLLFARFGVAALQSMEGLARRTFRGTLASALLAGISAHSMVPLDHLATASFGLVLATAGHAVGWPIASGGSRAIVDALVNCLQAHGGEVVTGFPVEHIDQLPEARAYLFDVAPRHLVAIAGDRLSARYRKSVLAMRHGPGIFKMDWALRGPVPWRDPTCARAATVHLSGTLAEVASAEAAAHAGTLASRPFVLFVQPTLFDPSRAPRGMHIAWAYCHVPHGSAIDASAAIEAQVERAAPGFGALVVARHATDAQALAAYNPNFVGGDITGGSPDLRQLFFRPAVRLDPYATSARDIYLCSASTPPGGGVHGMCGYWAARSALARVFRHAPR